MIKDKKTLYWVAFGTILFASFLGLPYAAQWLLPPPDKSEFRQPQTNAQRPSEPRSPQSPSTISRNSTASSNPTPASDPFRVWISGYSALPADSPRREEILQAGITLAKARRPRMEQLIRENPRQALAEGLRFHEWTALPEEIKPEVEQPFSATADYSYLPICREPGTPRLSGEPDAITLISLQDGKTRSSFSYGMRANLMSKNSLPAQGIALGDHVAMREEAFQIVEPAEEAAIQSLFPLGQLDSTRSFASGEKLQDEPVLAVAGGRVYSFASEEEVQTLNHLFGELEALPGPFGAWGAFLASPSEFVTTEGSLDVPKIQAKATAQSSESTLTKKRLFLIRINFPDRQEEPGTQAAAEEGMSNASEIIREMSYGKTWVEAKASAKVYMMPKPFVYYTSNSTDKVAIEKDPAKNALFFGEMMRDARNAFRTNKNGEDSAINIGPVDQSFVGGSSGLGDYDIVGLRRIPLPIPGGEGGYASGSELFMTGDDERTFVHEFGHNYGLGHASLWKTNDGSITGNGSSEEYGDVFDVMGRGQVPFGHFHMQAKARLKWLPQTDWADADLSGSGTYRVFRIDSKELSSGLRGVRVARGGNATANGYYWLGHRGALESNLNLFNGGYILWEKPLAARSWLLDMTPESLGGAKDSSLPLGKTFADPLSGAFITPISKGGVGDGTYIDFRVNIGPFPGNNAPQVGEISGPSTVEARKPVNFSISASDPNGDLVAFSWDSAGGTLATNPLSSNFQGQWETGGNYEIKVTVSDMKGGTVTKTKPITVTDPLDNWSTTSVGRSVTLLSAKSGNGLLVAAGYWGEIFYSWDGISWQESQTIPDMKEPRLEFGAGRFVIVGKRHNDLKVKIAYSRDGRIWEAVNAPDTPPPHDLAYGGGKFLAIGEQGSVLSSLDGINWTVSNVSANPDFRSLAWNGNSWLAYASTPELPNNVAAWTSLDGLTWTKGKNLGNASAPVLAHNSVFFYNSWGKGIRRTMDAGMTFQSMPDLLGVDSWSARHVAVSDNGVFFAHGHVSGEEGVPLISTDGVSWYQSKSASASEALKSSGVWWNGKVWGDQIAYGAGRFIKVGFNGVVKYSQPLASSHSSPSITAATISGPFKSRGTQFLSANASASNGASLRYFWDFGQNLPVLEGKNASFILPFGGSYDVKLRAVDSTGAVSVSNQTLSLSDPALTFTKRESGAIYFLAAIAANDSIAVAVGDANHAILTSTNGANWTKRTLPHWTYLHDIVWDGFKFIVLGHSWRNLGKGSEWHNVILTSPDGSLWTERYLAPFVDNLHLRTLTSKPGGPALAGGDQGLFLRSADGVNWSPQTISALGNLTVRDMEWSGREFALVTSEPTPTQKVKILTSTDGIQWADRTSGNLVNTVWELSQLNGRLFATGWTGSNSKMRISLDDGRNFTFARLSENMEFPAMAYGGGIYFGAGFEHVSGYPNADVFSLNGNDWYSYESPTTKRRKDATYFKNTLITVGDDGEIWQSEPFTPVKDMLAIGELGFPLWDGSNSEVKHKFLGPPGQRRKLQFSPDLSQPWLDHGEIEFGQLGTLDATLRQSGDQRAKWNKKMFFRLLPAAEQ